MAARDNGRVRESVNATRRALGVYRLLPRQSDDVLPTINKSYRYPVVNVSIPCHLPNICCRQGDVFSHSGRGREVSSM